ncbi:SDR family NAD(P)-dependent oxidoreductase [Rhodococcus sp. IEGM 1408]|uniref:SDR family NAD(P)-dependent oxidoreductase n=1 Tax=Rhodococcus sp. IEGM 1408 TaxID=3082220 RepID=UPI002953AEBD|nr:SDR family NAD(P)-dependent oxidoreductase [Rhodococcus sp. IEGM 1408]MDV8000166.1 SDR family NAD(P)-dependent oxidoreductase [Rhodococcus sp. IEGM 1408]
MKLRRGGTRTSQLAGRSAIVTGGGSGIGAALSRALAAAGAHVVVADIDVEAARRVAEGIEGSAAAGAAAGAEAGTAGSGTARAVRLDVTDAAAVAALVDEVVAEHGGLDLMFANAGITWGGDTELLTLEQWNAIVDVNIRGVVHCVHAAYPHMIRRGSGALVLTASMGGLCPAGLITSYAMTKHAVVGLGLSLRAEAAGHGIGVTVVCPAAVETAILDKGELGGFNGRHYYLDGQGVREPLDPDELARSVLDGVAANRALVIEPARARATWRLQRLSPALMDRMLTRYVRATRRRRDGAPAGA